MPRVCTVCSHQQREEIDRALVNGESNRRIATQFSLSEAAIRRHKASHLPAQMAQAKQAANVAQADSLLAQAMALRNKAIGLLLKAEQAQDYRTALAGVREARGCLELMAKLEGELSDRPVVNILVMPEWVTVRSAMLAALRPYPEARQAVADALVRIEGADGSGN